MLNIGDKAPAFNLEGIDSEGNEQTFALEELLKEEKNIVLYFYPKDNTPGCTQESCDFRDNLNRLSSKALVVGVSPDSVKSHKGFQENQSLNFILLSDKDKAVAQAYDAYGEKKMYGKAYMGIIRSTFIIGSDGLIKKVWSNVKVKGHVDEVLASL
ncbi:MAG: peroxiredoxin [bacterium]